jgi:hypothetical protein
MLFLHPIYLIIIKTHLAYRTTEVAREREGITNLEIGSGFLLKFQSKEECSKTNLIKSMASVSTPSTPVFLLYRTITTGDNLTG